MQARGRSVVAAGAIVLVGCWLAAGVVAAEIWHPVPVDEAAAQELAMPIGPKPSGQRGGNYLCVVAQALNNTAGLNQFISAKTAQGYNVMTYVVPPNTPNTQIRSYIQSLWGTPNAPDYVLIVGDSPAVPHWIGQGSRHAPTDLYYACMDGGNDWYPDIYIGRFAVANAQQLQYLVDKSLTLDNKSYPQDPNNPYPKRAAFLAGDDAYAHADETHDWIINTYMNPAGFESVRIYEDQGGGTQDVTNAVNAGSLFVVYMGHSGTVGWWGPAFYQQNVQALSNNGRYGLVFGLSCNTANFPVNECFGETWIRQSQKGAAAYLSSSDYIFWGSEAAWEVSRRMEKYFFKAIFADNVIEVGPAWQTALYYLLADPNYGPGHEYTLNIFEEFVLLGDPSLRLPISGFVLTAEPTLESLCQPVSQTTYTIQVVQQGDYSESVSLSATGLPPGAGVQFSANHLPPPFTSIMTVSNLGNSPPGAYTIDVKGTSATAQRHVVVGLHLANSPPGSVTLINPPDDAVNVPRTPTLVWNAASQAAEYELQVATNSNFNNIVYSAVETQTSHLVTSYLSPLTEYFWRVRGVNGCGPGAFSPTFSFTTLKQPNYFTEPFLGNFDLDYFSIEFTPDGSSDFYHACGHTITELPTNPSGGEVVYLSDDGYVWVALMHEAWLYGESQWSLVINANGNITFIDGDPSYEESLSVHFNQLRISGVFDDLDPSAGGTVSWKELADRVAVTWLNVPETGVGNSNTFQIEMFFDGRIRMSWLRVDSDDSVVGLSRGLGVPTDFIATDLSATTSCVLGDLNCNGLVDGFDIQPFVLALTNPSEYAQQYPGCDPLQGDCNCSGALDGFDIQPFVICVTNGGCQCP